MKLTVDISKVKLFLVGNKNDQYEWEQIKKEDAEKYAKSIKATYRCVSALKDSGIKELFECVGRSFFKGDELDEIVAKEKESKEKQEDSKKAFSIDPEKNTNHKAGKKKCC